MVEATRLGPENNKNALVQYAGMNDQWNQRKKGERSCYGSLRVRYAYDVPKLQELLPDHVVACKPLHLDAANGALRAHAAADAARKTGCSQ